MGLGGEASYLRHEVQRNQKDPDNDRITAIALLIIAVWLLVCVVIYFCEEDDDQSATDTVEQTATTEQIETTESAKATEQAITTEPTTIQNESLDDGYFNTEPEGFVDDPIQNGMCEYNPGEDYNPEPEGWREDWEEEKMEDAIKAYDQQCDYDDGTPY